MDQKRHVFILVGVFLLVLVGYTVYMFYTRPAIAPTEDENTVDTTQILEEGLPDGVEIVERDGERFLKDENNRFEVLLEDQWEVMSPTNLVSVVINPNQDLGEGQSSFSIIKNDLFENNFDAEINSWLEMQNQTCKDCYELVEKINLNGKDVAVVKDKVALGSQEDYLFVEGEYLYDLFAVNLNLDFVEDILKELNLSN